MIRKEDDQVENQDNGLRIVEPYYFVLSLLGVKSFQPAVSEENNALHIATRIAGIPTLSEVRRNPANNKEIK